MNRIGPCAAAVGSARERRRPGPTGRREVTATNRARSGRPRRGPGRPPPDDAPGAHVDAEPEDPLSRRGRRRTPDTRGGHARPPANRNRGAGRESRGPHPVGADRRRARRPGRRPRWRPAHARRRAARAAERDLEAASSGGAPARTFATAERPAVGRRPRAARRVREAGPAARPRRRAAGRDRRPRAWRPVRPGTNRTRSPGASRDGRIARGVPQPRLGAADQVPAAWRLERVEAGLAAGDRDAAGRDALPRRRRRGSSSSGGSIAEVREPGHEADRRAPVCSTATWRRIDLGLGSPVRAATSARSGPVGAAVRDPDLVDGRLAGRLRRRRPSATRHRVDDRPQRRLVDRVGIERDEDARVPRHTAGPMPRDPAQPVADPRARSVRPGVELRGRARRPGSPAGRPPDRRPQRARCGPAPSATGRRTSTPRPRGRPDRAARSSTAPGVSPWTQIVAAGTATADPSAPVTRPSRAIETRLCRGRAGSSLSASGQVARPQPAVGLVDAIGEALDQPSSGRRARRRRSSRTPGHRPAGGRDRSVRRPSRRPRAAPGSADARWYSAPCGLTWREPAALRPDDPGERATWYRIDASSSSSRHRHRPPAEAHQVRVAGMRPDRRAGSSASRTVRRIVKGSPACDAAGDVDAS